MSQLIFRYGVVGSAKTANALMLQYNLSERNQSALLVKPKLATRDGERLIASRCGLSAPCIYMEDLTLEESFKHDCVIVDEAQFLTKSQVFLLVDIVDTAGIPVFAYGLRTDFKGELFEGSHWLLACADCLEELSAICWCGKKATYTARIENSKIIKIGKQSQPDNESHVALCRKHWIAEDLGQFL